MTSVVCPTWSAITWRMQRITGWSVGSSNAPPLDGITVLDLTRVLSGPYCTMLLADMGARVIKIEQPDKGDDTRAWGPPFVNGESVYFLSINRNKESVTLDFKTPEGRGLLDRLIAKADVVVENFRPGVLKKLGLDYETLAATHPRLDRKSTRLNSSHANISYAVFC